MRNVQFCFEEQLRDAIERFTIHMDAQASSQCVDLYAWNQFWANTTCGFGGCGGQAITRATTAVFHHVSDIVAVYHARRLARFIPTPTEAFWKACRERCLPGAADEEAWQKLLEE